VLAVDTARGTLECGGMTSYFDLAGETLARGVMPGVVPQLKSITIGGAAAGVGIESTSFREGLVHEGLLALDVLLADGSVITCTPHNEHRDLFFGFPNSYGTLGYALKVTARTRPVKRYVELTHVKHRDAGMFFSDLARFSARDDAVDFVDGVIFSGAEMYVTVGRLVDEAPWTSDYTYERIYYRSIRERERDYLTIRDYLWRWDTDWFWCSKNLGAQYPLVRRLLGRERLNSITYQRVMRWNARWGLTRALDRLAGRRREAVIQDVDLPIGRAREFLDFLLREIDILPIWICPIRAADPACVFPLYRMPGEGTFVNFGFWDTITERVARPRGYHNRNIEREVQRLGGIKSLYSDCFFPEEEFRRVYGGEAYAALKARYDPQGRLGDLYGKCVLRR